MGRTRPLHPSPLPPPSLPSLPQSRGVERGGRRKKTLPQSRSNHLLLPPSSSSFAAAPRKSGCNCNPIYSTPPYHTLLPLPMPMPFTPGSSASRRRVSSAGEGRGPGCWLQCGTSEITGEEGRARTPVVVEVRRGCMYAMLTKSFLKWAGGNRGEEFSIVDGAVYLRFHMLVDTCM